MFKLDKGNPNVSYLMFADDCLTFCRATKGAVWNVNLFGAYCKVSSQLINYHHKFKIQFSNGVLNAGKGKIAQVLQ